MHGRSSVNSSSLVPVSPGCSSAETQLGCRQDLVAPLGILPVSSADTAFLGHSTSLMLLRPWGPLGGT